MYQFLEKKVVDLMVHDVGNYKITVAPSLEALEERVDWTQFDTADDFSVRKAILTDAKLFGEVKMGYIVAQAQRSVNDDGFAVLYPDAQMTYFPTCHENTEGQGDKAYDVRCYSWDRKRIQSFPFSIPESFKGRVVRGNARVPSVDGHARCFTLTDAKVLHAALQTLGTDCVRTSDGQSASFAFDLDAVNVVNFCPIKGRTINQNIFLSASTTTNGGGSCKGRG
jgi:hypothetical protein